MNKLTDELDTLFGFQSTWTANCGDGCGQLGGEINIDDDEIDGILAATGGDANTRALILRFVLGHEKGHHLQETVWPTRDYSLEHHLMEIEADLIGAWALALQNQVIAAGAVLEVVKQFDDAYRIAQRLGAKFGDDDGNDPHHPWAEQRELALVRGPLIAFQYRGPLTVNTRTDFAIDIRRVAEQILVGNF